MMMRRRIHERRRNRERRGHWDAVARLADERRDSYEEEDTRDHDDEEEDT